MSEAHRQTALKLCIFKPEAHEGSCRICDPIAEALEATHAKGREEERERCAKIAEEWKSVVWTDGKRNLMKEELCNACSEEIAKAIREDAKEEK